jgi:hypothetical protein
LASIVRACATAPCRCSTRTDSSQSSAFFGL